MVPVVVTSSGRHVEGLRESDFVLLDNGSPRKIASFEELKSATAVEPARKLGPGVFSNAPPNEQPQRIMVLLLDLLNTPFQKQSFSREALMRFLLGRPDVNEPVMLVAFTPDGLRVIHHFTSDSSLLITALRNVRKRLSDQEIDDSKRMSQDATLDAIGVSAARNQGNPDADEVQQLSALMTAIPHYAAISRDQDRTMQTLYQMQQLAGALAGVPGRKSLVWVTGGLSFYEYLPDTMAVPDRRNIATSVQDRGSRVYEINKEFERTWAMLNDASIAVYPIDVAEVTVPSFTEAMFMLPNHVGSALLKSQAMLGFTENTGGSYCQLQATLENCFRDAMSDSAHYYLLSFYADSHAKAGWHKLQVKAPGKAVHLRSRGGYFQENAASSHQSENTVTQVMSSPLDSTAVLLAVHWLDAPSTVEAKRHFEMFVDPNSISFNDSGNHMKLSVMVASSDDGVRFTSRSVRVLDAKLTPENLKKVIAEGVVYRQDITLPKGTVAVRFAVRDDLTGRIGTVTARD
jgi:VWFA-related protein